MIGWMAPIQIMFRAVLDIYDTV